MHFYSLKNKILFFFFFPSPPHPHPRPVLNCFQDLAKKGESPDLGTFDLKCYPRTFTPSVNPQIDVSCAHV